MNHLPITHANRLLYSRNNPISIRLTETGRGVFARVGFPAQAVIGEIKGEVFHDQEDEGSEYAFDLGDDWTLEPYAPFRFINHSCDPNCEFDAWQEDKAASDDDPPRLYLIALRDIHPGEQLTIDYNWSADSAIVCDCRSPICRGWIVCPSELGLLLVPRDHE